MRWVITGAPWALIAIALLGCRDTQTDGGALTSSAATAAPRPWPSNAPPASACTTHDDCTMIVWDGPSPPDPCCDARVGYMPVARRYLAFMQAYRKGSCAGVTCPSAPFPGAEPACCAGVARCVAGQCVSGCKDPTVDFPKVSVLDPTCRLGPSPLPPEGLKE